MSKTVIFDL